VTGAIIWDYIAGMSASASFPDRVMTDDLSPHAVRLKRLSFRAWHRGMKELDLILGRFADERLTTMSEDELAMFEEIIALPDVSLYRWLSGREAVPPAHDSAMLAVLKARCDAGAVQS